VAQSHNLGQLAEQAFERHGDYESVWFEGRWYRSGDLFERAARVAAGLRELVRPGERVVVMAANSPDVPALYNAVWRAGAVVTPAIFLLPPPELQHVLANSEAAVAVASAEFVDTVADAAADVPSVRAVLSLDDLPEADREPVAERSDDDLAALLYTGGTTGRAKGVMLSHSNLWHAGRLGHEAGYVPGLTRGLGTLPLSHAYGLLVTVVGLHHPERTVAVLMRWFDPERFLELAQEHRVQISAVVPSMIAALLAQPLERYDLLSLRYLACGAAPLARELVDELRRRLPNVEVREGYGLTETSALVSTNPPGAVRVGSVGLPVPGSEVRILDSNDRELAAGEVGEICCRSPLVMRGYWRDAEATAAATRGGWLHTGDLGYLDEDGYLYVVDRKKDLIIRDGFNVFPRDVEDALLEHPAVVAAAVVGRPDDRHGEEVVAFVELAERAEAAADELVSFAQARVGRHKYPREVRVVSSIPLTPIGKVDRKALRAHVEAAVS
jgi:long-chain acyl-CoA synthetase